MDLEKANEPGQRHDEHRHSERQRQPPVRYGQDEYADTHQQINMLIILRITNVKSWNRRQWRKL